MKEQDVEYAKLAYILYNKHIINENGFKHFVPDDKIRKSVELLFDDVDFYLEVINKKEEIK